MPYSSAEKDKAWRDANRVRLREANIEWFKAHPGYHCERITSSIELYLKHAVAQSRQRTRWENTITFEQVLDLWDKQEGRCALSGVKMTYRRTKGISHQTNVSLDRIDSKKGYTIGNVRLVCRAANSMKGDLPDGLFIHLCKRVAERNP